MIVILLLMVASSANAISFSQLTIVGDDSQPGIVGEYSQTALFSWMNQVLAGNDSGFSWTLAGGTDGGVVFDKAQAVGEMTGVRPMFNQPTGFYSINSGINIAADNTIDMSNLMMSHAGESINIGAGSGFNPFVPLVLDISLLTTGENGWMLNNDNTYHLIFNTGGTCNGCLLQLHFYGTAVVPVPAAIWLFGSGLLGLTGWMRFTRRE